MSKPAPPPATDTPLRVLYLLDFLRPGVGVPETLKHMVEPFRAAGVELHVAPFHREPGDLFEEFAARGVPMLDLETGRNLWLLRRMQRIVRHARAHRIRLLHANEFRAIHLAVNLVRFVPWLRVIGHLRVTGNVRSSSGRRERWLRRHSRRMREIVAVSQAVLEDYRDASGHHELGRVIWNGRPLDRFAPAADAGRRAADRQALALPEGVLLLVCAASLQPSKDHPTLLRAAARLARDGAAFLLLIAGEGPDLRKLEELAAELRIADRVRFLGRRDDVPRLLRCADLYVSTSLREGLPGSVIEAQASGLPCVVTRCGGPEEVVIDGVTGIVAPPEDADAFACGVATLLRDAALRGRMGTAAREQAGRFGIGPAIETWAALYRDVAAR